MADDDASPKRVKHPVKAARGRRGGRPPKYERTVPPPELAIPPKRKGGDGGTGPGSPEVRFSCEPARWELFCDAYADCLGKVAPAARAAGLPVSTAEHWFRLAAEGQEPYRTEIAKAHARAGYVTRVAGRGLVARNPLEALHRLDPKTYPRERQELDLTSGGESLSAALLAFREGGGEPSSEGSGEDQE